MRTGRWIVCGLVLAASMSCGREQGAPFDRPLKRPPPPDSGTPTATPTPLPPRAFELGGFPARLDLPPGTTATLPVSVRRGAYSGAIQIRVVAADQVHASPIVIAAGAHEGVLQITSEDGPPDLAVRGVRVIAQSIDAPGGFSEQILEVSRGWTAGDYATGANPPCLYPKFAPAPDGGLYVACVERLRTGTPEHDVLVVERRNPDGAEDASFGAGGTVEIDAQAEITFVPDALVTDSALTIAIDTRGDSSTDGGLLARIDAHGTPIATFGTGGIIQLTEDRGLLAIGVMNEHPGRLDEIGSTTAYFARDLVTGAPVSCPGGLGDAGARFSAIWAAVTPDRIYARTATSLGRYLENGSLDAGFGELGRIDSTSFPNWLGRDDDVFTGFSHGFEPVELYVLKRDRRGVQDETFGTNGVVWDDFIWPDHVFEDSQGRVVVAGNQSFEGAGGYEVRRYLPDGTSDASGRFWTATASTKESPVDSLLLRDDRIVVLQNGSLRVVSE